MPRQYKREPLTAEEANRLANACQTAQERLIVWTLLDTGLRVSELASLKRDDIDWQRHVFIIHGKGGPFGKKSKRRLVPVSTRVMTLIEHHFALHDSVGVGVRSMQLISKQIANRAHISRPVSPHVLRHTFSVLAVQKGISIKALQSILGHDRLATTEIYLNMSPEEALREFREKW